MAETIGARLQNLYMNTLSFHSELDEFIESTMVDKPQSQIIAF
ncbi:hypothetical protein PROFUN_07492 [Planoprotostelium fungivorum]|uniref:Uncharacterized protein n=1 Tax=Planoprotostelium fungivorum TaxID=1890364 RepID=A0A2P6NLQ5_9EUKA|nr:hypothetical protein PROFUN_07492 [Planoprotostelium fungivorum]